MTRSIMSIHCTSDQPDWLTTHVTNIKTSSLDPVNQTSQGDADQTQATLDFKDDNLIIHCVSNQLPQINAWLIRIGDQS